MPALGAGDKTTLLLVWMKTNANGGEVMKVMKPLLATETGLPNTEEVNVLFEKFVKQG